MYWFQELSENDYEKLRNGNTYYLLKLRNKCYEISSDYDYYSEEVARTFDDFQRTLYNILDTREHVLNKEERKEVRLQKAHERKYGR